MICTRDYGRCRRCHEGVPYTRLQVQPDALLCVPCLSLAEKEPLQHSSAVEGSERKL
ncbi:MAG: TraR/DksA C4-type zinc finger protein [Nitrospira sp.]|nr:TraR/DksA C4-type zinc finger protein [Nitrospira sp.]